jgi:hypothetical protein
MREEGRKSLIPHPSSRIPHRPNTISVLTYTNRPL